MSIHVLVSDLPLPLINALKSLGYGRKDIAVSIKENQSIVCGGGDGYRGFACIVNLATNEHKTIYGSWGGANMFNPNNAVDLDYKDYTLPKDCAVITGHEGGSKPVYATVTIPPSNVLPCLTAKPSVSDKEKSILYAYGALKSGKYRQDELARIGATVAEIDKLISEGYLDRNKVGIKITIKGKNARGDR